MNRPPWLSVSLVPILLLVAGCSTPATTPTPGFQDTQQVSIPAGNQFHASYRAAKDSVFSYRVDVASSATFGVYLVNQSEMPKVERGEQFDYYEDASHPTATRFTSDQYPIGPGDYGVVVGCAVGGIDCPMTLHVWLNATTS